MKIQYFNLLDSTHKYIKQYVKINGYKTPLAIVALQQTDGIGSRDNKWNGKKGNLFLSFVLDKSLLPLDLPLQSASIYFSFILKEVLKSEGSNVWMKWPNDFYNKNKKIGGTITSVNLDLIYCGIGLNLTKVNDNFGFLDIDITIEKLLNKYFQQLEKYPTWKQVFSKFEIEFQNNNDFTANIKSQKKILLKDAILQDDGSLLVDGQKVFSLR